MVVGARMSGPRESDGHVTVSCDPVHSTKQPANPQVAHKFPPIRSQIEVKHLQDPVHETGNNSFALQAQTKSLL